MSAAANTFRALLAEVDDEANVLWASGSGIPDVATARRMARKIVSEAIGEAERVWQWEDDRDHDLCREEIDAYARQAEQGNAS